MHREALEKSGQAASSIGNAADALAAQAATCHDVRGLGLLIGQGIRGRDRKSDGWELGVVADALAAQAATCHDVRMEELWAVGSRGIGGAAVRGRVL